MYALDSYDWDVFISYRRPCPARAFVRAFRPELELALGTYSTPARVFLDDEALDNGAHPRSTLDALSRSACVLAIWTPSYPESPWCLAEWLSMRAREAEVHQAGIRVSLVYPVVYSTPAGGAVSVLAERPAIKPHADIGGAKHAKVRMPTEGRPSRELKLFAETVAGDLAAILRQVPAAGPTFPLRAPPALDLPPIPLVSRP